MRRTLVSWFRVVTLAWMLALVGAIAVADDLGTFLAEKTDALEKLRAAGTTSGDSITAILDEVASRVQSLPEGGDRTGGTQWLAMQYAKLGNNAKAAETLDSLGKDSGLSAEVLRNSQIQAARYWSQAHDSEKANDRWNTLLNDSTIDADAKNGIVTDALDSARASGDWQGVCTLAKAALDLGVGDRRDVYTAMGKAAIEVGDYKLGEQAYQSYHTEFPDAIPPRLMYDYDKQAALCHNEGKTDTVGYLDDMKRLLDNYKSDDKTRADMGGRLSEEYAALGQKWMGIAKAYADRGEDSPLPLDETRQKAVELASAAFEGLDALTKEQQDNMVNFNTSLMSACFTAAESLATLGRVTEGQALLERLKAKLPESESDPAIAERILVESRKLPLVAAEAQKPVVKATPIPTPGPMVAAAAPADTIQPTPLRMPRTTAAKAPGETAAPTLPASVPEAAGQGGMGAGMVALIVLLVAAAAALLLLAMRKPKVQ